MHGKRAIVEPARVLSADEVAERVCGRFGCVHDRIWWLPRSRHLGPS